MQQILDSLLRFRPSQRGLKRSDGGEEPVGGNDTWLTRFFAAAMARRSKEAIRRASASTKLSSSASGSARLTYPYRSAVSPSKSFAPRTIERPTPTDQMWKTFRTAAAGMQSHFDT